MKKLFRVFVTLACTTSGAMAQSPSIPGSWTPTFQEEFNGSWVDGNKWRLGTHYAGIAGSGGISPQNVTVSGGTLKLTSEQRAVSMGGTNYSYATGEVSTFAQFRQQYGYFEARIKYPYVKGLWPAFWLMPDRAQYGALNSYYRSYIKFDLTAANIAQVNTAELRLRVSSIEAGPTNNLVCMKVVDSWTESGITWNNKPVPNPIWVAQKWNNQVTAGQEIVIDLKAFVTQEMAGDKKVSVVLADTFMRTKFIKFHSSEAATAADRPRLVVNGTTYYASEDATVRRGDYANTNYGNALDLTVEEEWGNGVHTYTDGMEVDIMESLGIWGSNLTDHALHWDGYDADHKSTGWHKISYPPTSDGFHTYGVYWQAGLLEFYVDGVKTATYSNSRVMSVPAFMILSLQLGGWDNNTVGSQVHNQVMEVDWVRAWSGTRTPFTQSEVIVDNPAATATGAWTASTATAGFYGSNYLHDGNTAKGTKTVRFTPSLPSSGKYWVYGRWTADPGRANNVPFDIAHTGGTSTVSINQQVKGGNWIALGSYNFNSGTAGNVLIRTTGTSGHVIADSVRFLRVAP